MQHFIEETAYEAIRANNPQLLEIIRIFIVHGKTSEQIIRICMRRTGLPRHRLAFIGCAAAHLIRAAANSESSGDTQ